MMEPSENLMSERSQIAGSFLPAPGSAPVEWRIEPGLTGYEEALAVMEARAGAIRDGTEGELVWLVEHPPLYTAGTSARVEDLVEPDRFPVFNAGRGGEYTYHGPGQRVAYVMLDLKRRREDVRAFIAALETWIIATLAAFNIRGERREDVRAFVAALEDWIIAALAAFNVRGERREDRVGVWVVRPDRPPMPDGSAAEEKIAAIGIRLRRWVSFHGIAINVEPDLSHFTGIVPCGVADHGVTSLVDLGLPVAMADLDLVLKSAFVEVFGPVLDVAGAQHRRSA
jgi:lipoyl(octanoyl) transferase